MKLEPKPIDCYNCKRGFHPDAMYETCNGRYICETCIATKVLTKRIKTDIEHKIPIEEILKDIIIEKEIERYINSDK